MSTLTKICVVLLVLLALFASVVFIQSAASKKNWRNYAETQTKRKDQAETKAAYMELVAGNWRRLYGANAEAAKVANDRYQSDLAGRDSRNAALARELGRVQVSAAESAALNHALQSTIDDQVKQNDAMADRLEKWRSKNIQLADQLRVAEDKINVYTTDLENARKSAQFLQEQLTQREGEINDLTSRVARLTKELAIARASSGFAAAPTETVIDNAPRIDGEVLAVDGDLASLNVGRASGVKRGMEFKIYRGAEFVAHLKVARVDASTCAGMIRNRVGEVKRGDKASTRLDTE